MWIVLLVAALAASGLIGCMRLVAGRTPLKADEHRAPYLGM
jgi:hypothetical protein